MSTKLEPLLIQQDLNENTLSTLSAPFRGAFEDF